MKVKIENIQPKPLYRSLIEFDLNKSETNFINKLCKNTIKNSGNFFSNDSYILNKKPLSELKKQIQKRIEDYFEKIICPKDPVVPYITESWLNITNKNGYHPSHDHPNSIISGVFYLNKTEITFQKREYEPIRIDPKNFNIYNSYRWTVPTFKNEVILFPSDLLHLVNFCKNDNRMSIAFNVFIKGKLGTGTRLAELNLC